MGLDGLSEAKEHNNAHFMVVDPRFNRSASVADFYAPKYITARTPQAMRPGQMNYWSNSPSSM